MAFLLLSSSLSSLSLRDFSVYMWSKINQLNLAVLDWIWPFLGPCFQNGTRATFTCMHPRSTCVIIYHQKVINRVCLNAFVFGLCGGREESNLTELVIQLRCGAALCAQWTTVSIDTIMTLHATKELLIKCIYSLNVQRRDNLSEPVKGAVPVCGWSFVLNLPSGTESGHTDANAKILLQCSPCVKVVWLARKGVFSLYIDARWKTSSRSVLSFLVPGKMGENQPEQKK